VTAIRPAIVVVSAVLALVVRDAGADDPAPLAPAPLLDRVARAATDLARQGRRAEAEEMADVAAELRAPNAAALKDSVAKALAKAKPPAGPSDSAKTVAKLAADLAALLPTLDGDAKTAVARQALRVDASSRAAHEALGEIERGGAWLPAWFAPLLLKRAAVEEAVRAARRIEVPVTVGEADCPLLETIHGKKGVKVTAGDLSAQSAAVGADRLERQLRQVVRATALLQWLLGGELKVPERRGTGSTIVFDRREDYLRAMDLAEQSGLLTKESAALGRRLDAHRDTGDRWLHAAGEIAVGQWAFLDATSRQDFDGRTFRAAPACLRAGLVNWICARFLGCPAPRIAWVEPADAKKGATSDTPQEQAERTAMLRLAKAGFSGLRHWLRWLARRGEDPPWSRSMVDEMGRIGGDEMGKCTFVVDHLIETGELAAVTRGAWDAPTAPASYEKALGETLPEFEHHWREWLLAGEPCAGVLQRIAPAPTPARSATESACLACLDAIRARAVRKGVVVPLAADPELGEGCRAHALYLAKNPAQAAAWPDAHEEYPDREGFSAEGGRAGLSSVIAPGTTSAEGAIDAWMASFYHRVPLLAPGLLRVGWALEKGFAVLDVESLVADPERLEFVAWPPPGATNVPRRFGPELPNPVPGADQAAWGYPVTLQFWNYPVAPSVRMRLHVGSSRAGVEVPCHFSTPTAPTNPQLAPAGAFCLIPKQTLAANTTYTVAVDDWPSEWKGADWTFTTAAK